MDFFRHQRGAYVITDLIVWEFSGDEEIVRHIADQVANAIIISYNMGNFGPDAFTNKYNKGEE